MATTFDLADPLGRARMAILSAVVEGDAGLALDIITGLMAEGVGFDTVLFDVIAPLQREVGHRWAEGDFRIAEEHASTGAMETVVAMLSGSFEADDDATRLVVACAEGDTHSLPARMVAAYLGFLGHRTTFLGSSIPAADLGGYLADVRPAALVLSCALVTRLPGARASIAVAHEAGVPVLAGGQAFGTDEERAARLGADGWAAAPRKIEEVIGGWEPDTEASERHAVASCGDIEALETSAAAAVDEASAIARSRLSQQGVSTAVLRTEIRPLLDAVIAGGLVDEPGLILGFSEWHGSVRSTGLAGRDHTRALLESLRRVVAPISPEAGRHLDLAVEAEI
jgi:methanogenic corrinoid protein MtbC1